MWICINNLDQVIWLAKNWKWAWHINLLSMARVNTIWSRSHCSIMTSPSAMHLRCLMPDVVCMTQYKGFIIIIILLLLYRENMAWHFMWIICYCPFDITRKDVLFSWCFYFKWKYSVLIDHILSETICLFCFCVFLFSNIYPKINLPPKTGFCHFYSKEIFLFLCLRKDFLLFFDEFELLMFPNNIVKISERLKKQNLLKICLKVTYLTDFCINSINFYNEKKWKYLIF